MFTLVREPLASWDETLPAVPLRTDRRTLAKRVWRGRANDGHEFGFELQAALKHGDAIFQNARCRYVVQQEPEPVLAISLDIPASAAAGIGWAVGNLHLELAAEASRLLTPDEPAVRQLMSRLNVPIQQTTAIFRPGRFVRGQQPSHELGSSHRHG